MTRPYRRDADTKGGSVITGLRMERPLAQRLTDAAREDARQRGEINTKTERPVADLGRQTRLLLRLALWDGATEDPAGQCTEQIAAGLKVEPALAAAIRERAAQEGLNTSGTIRHLLRINLAWTPAYSRSMEDKFAEIGRQKRALQEAS